jgi:hypothetical protein
MMFYETMRLHPVSRIKEFTHNVVNVLSPRRPGIGFHENDDQKIRLTMQILRLD